MTAYNVEIRVKRLVPRAELHPDDRRSGPIGEYYWPVEADNPEAACEAGLDWFHNHHAIAVLDDHEISTVAWVDRRAS